MLSLLQRKIFAEIVQVFVLTLFVILCLILMGRALQLRELLFGLELGLGDTLMLFVYMSPTFLQLAAPIACMISIFIVFLRLESDREMMALKAGGLSLYQLLPAPVIVSSLVTAITLYLAIFGISWGMYSFRDTILEVASERAKIVVQAGVFNKDIPGFVLYAKNVDPLTGFMNQVLVNDSNTIDISSAATNLETSSDNLDNSKKNNVNTDTKNITTILAPEGFIEIDKERSELLFLLKDGKIYSAEDKTSTILSFREYIVSIPLSNVFAGLDLGPVKPKEMSLKELNELPVDLIRQEDTRLANKILIERHKRFIFPFACFVLGLLAIPISIACSGVKKQQGLGIALLVFIVYYGFLSTGISLGEGGDLNPYLGIWLPSFVFIALALFGIYRYNNVSNKG